ncbi:type IVB secretion system protein IcmH/DotU [Endosaccharibacter trunci]|uniref:type IVB secretion system protein IcmH/DotU n=1 Tax=Endosaccharibacter trunci TaxID=2812733 RepID=UPI003BF466C6
MSGRNDNNPFSEPEDDDHTIIVPREAVSALSARRYARDDAERNAAPAAPPGEAIDFAAIPPVGDGPIVQAAQPLLALMARLRNVVSVPDPGALREKTVQELRRFETILREAKVPPEHLRLGHYALCTSLDDVVQCTPWGSQGPWAQISLTSAFHKDVRGGERFFEILSKLLASPSRYLPLIELMYLCMSLGMHGRYRLSPRGPAELDRLREETYAAIRSLRDAPPADLSPRWRGLAAPFRPLRFEIPIWLAALIAAGLLALAYALVLFSLADGTDRVTDTAQSMPPLTMPVLQRPSPVPPPVVPQVAGLRTQLLAQLAADIKSGRISVAGTEMVPILRLQSDGMFALGQASIEPRFIPTLQHLADVLSKVNGVVRIIGYTDSQPIHTLAFPSNFDLSRARARAAAAVIGEKVDPSHIVTAGRGAEAPCASNATEAGRRANRRVEIIVESSGPN